MPKKFNKPTRMCIACRERASQESFLRLHCKNGEIVAYSGSGRSFYLCKSCLENEKKLTKALMRQCRTSDKNKLLNRLKEIITDDRKS